MKALRSVGSFLIICLMVSQGLSGAASGGGGAGVGAAAAASGIGKKLQKLRRALSGEPMDIDVPKTGIIYYVPRSQDHPLPWVATNRALLELAIKKSNIGEVLALPSNVFFISDEWAERLRRDGGGAFAPLYYVIDGDETKALWTGPKQDLIRDAIRDSGYRFAPNQSANVFYVKEEWAAALKGAGASEMLLAYVARGDASLSIHYGPKKALVRDAIVSEGWQHVVGQAPNIYWVSSTAATSLQAAIEVASDIFFVPDREVFISRGARGGTSTVWVRTSDNKGLLLQAIDDSKMGLAYGDNVFYVTREWFAQLAELSNVNRIICPWTTTQKVFTVVALAGAAAVTCTVQ